MSNKVKINGKKPKKEPVMELTQDETNNLDQIAAKVREAYKEEEELKEKMLELAAVHIEAHAASIAPWDDAMAKAVEVINTGREIYTGSWEGRLLWLERAAEVMQLDVTRSAEYNDGEIHLYWSDVDGKVMMKDGEPELRIETMDHLRSLCLIKVPDDKPANDKG